MTAPPASILTDFVEGFAQLLAAANIGLAWTPDVDYPAGQPGIWYPTAPADAYRPVVLGPWSISDDPAAPTSTLGLQIRTRSATHDIRQVYEHDTSIAAVLLGNYPLTLPTGLRVITLVRSSGQPPQRDDQNRWNGLTNWTAQVYNPTPHRY